jgi:hypothetical protein
MQIICRHPEDREEHQSEKLTLLNETLSRYNAHVDFWSTGAAGTYYSRTDEGERIVNCWYGKFEARPGVIQDLLRRHGWQIVRTQGE